MGQLRAVDLSETKDALRGIFERLTALCGGSNVPPSTEQQAEAEQSTKCEQTPAPIIIDRRRQMMELFGISEVQRGDSWKDNLQRAIDAAMAKSKTRENFTFNMERQGYFVKWTDARKTITYTCPNGKSCRDDRLFGERCSKSNMEMEFDYRERKKEPETVTGWESQRDRLRKKPAVAVSIGKRKLTDEILHHAKYLEQGVSEDDELETITELSALTALSFAGVYMRLDAIANTTHKQINDQSLQDYIEELKREPENCIDYEDEQERFGFTMM